MGFKIKAADGTTLEIADGDFYFNTKARARRMCLNSLSSDARRVYACLELATMSWKQELAVIMEAGEKRPLTPNDIRLQTGLLKQHVTRGLVELEDAGLAERRAPDGGALRKGNVLIYSWAVPREPKKENSNRARLLFPDWFPESWEPLKAIISKEKYSITIDEVTARGYFEEGAEVARGYQESKMVAARFLERISAQPQSAVASLCIERTEIYKERTSSSAVVAKVQAAKAEEDGTLYKKFKDSYPETRFDESEAKPIFEGKTKTEQLHILERLQVYLQCDRWKDDGGRWIKWASNWLKVYEADPPARFTKHRSSRQPASEEEVLKYMEMSDEFNRNAVEINDALLNGRPLPPRHQELLDYMQGRR
jgi:hypothetical protein